MRHRQRGFTVIEVLMALAIVLPVSVGLIAVARAALRGAQGAAALGASAARVDELVERLDAESHSAAAIFEPATDVLGQQACDGAGNCRELDFFTRDVAGAPHFWAYRYDAKSRALQRYDYDDLGAGGPVNLRAVGPGLPLVAFSASRLPVSETSIHALGPYVPKDVAVGLGYAQFSGGNALAVVDVTDPAFHLRHELVPRLAATGFTVVVGTYTPAPQNSPQPTPTPGSGGGELRSYIAYEMWDTGPCVNMPPSTPGCGPGGEGLQQDQQGSSYGPGGALVAPPNSQIPLGDVCQNPDEPPNPSAQTPLGEYDAAGLLYGVVSDPSNGVTEAWYVPPPHQLGYIAPTPPLAIAHGGEPNPFAPTMNNGPGYSYDTIYQVGC